MTDIGLSPPSYDGIKGWIADLARPFAIYSTTAAVFIAVITVAQKVVSSDAAFFTGALTAMLGSLYGFKAWENSIVAKQAASVQVAQAQTTTGQ